MIPTMMDEESDEMETRPEQGGFPLDGAALKQLCSLLRNNAHTVLNQEASFILTTEVLNRLNGDFRRHSVSLTENVPRPPSACEVTSWRPLRRMLPGAKKREAEKKGREREEWMKDVQFIKDFMLSTPTLKVIHRHKTLSFPLSLKRFGNLQVLEVRRVPVHLMEGLQALRGTLHSVTCMKSVPFLKDLLESCGGDRSVPMTWAKLKFLSLVFNNIRQLDDSLRLASHLQHLDLSHNQIDDTQKYLENLLDVCVVNLSYNKMISVPTFSVTTRTSLTSLFVRGNQLENIQGVECLSVLEVLDVGENYLVDHTVLVPIRGLHRLRMLLLDLNPLFYHSRHRKLTVCFLHNRAVGSQFVLDHKKLTGSEVGAYNPHVSLRLSPRVGVLGASVGAMSVGGYGVGGVDPRTTNMSPFSHNLATQNPGLAPSVADHSSESIIATSTPRKGGGGTKRRRLKARHTEIRDLDTSGDLSSSLDATPRGSPTMRNLERQMRERTEEALKTQREVERLREVYGSNWLQAIQDRNIFEQPSKSSASASDSPASDSDKNGTGKGTKKDRGVSTPSSADLVEDDGNCVKKDGEGSEERKNENEDQEGVEKGNEGTEEGDLERRRNNASSPQPTDDDLYLTETITRSTTLTLPQVNNPIMATIAKMVSGQGQSETENEHDKKLMMMKRTQEQLSSSAQGFGVAAKQNDNGVVDSPKQVSSGCCNSPLENSGDFKQANSNDEKSTNSNSARLVYSASADKNISSSASSSEVKAARKKLDFSTVEPATVGSVSKLETLSGVNEDCPMRGKDTKGKGKVRTGPSGEDRRTPVVPSAADDGLLDTSEGQGQTGSKTSNAPPSGSNGEISLERSTSELDSSTDISLAESERESEPMFVSLPESEDNTMIMVTTLDEYILEKDVRGKVKEKLDIRSLVSMTTKKLTKRKQTISKSVDVDREAEEEEKGGNPGVKMVLKFSYVRKDRRRRCYLLDAQDAENLRKHLQPFLDAKEEEEKKKTSVIMQCLKCNRSFQKKDVLHRSKDLPTSGSTKDLKVLKELMETPTLICPRCGSTMLIEVETTAHSSSSLSPSKGGGLRSRGSTVGSVTSQGSHSSTTSSNADVCWQQLQQLQHQQQPQQHQHLSPRKQRQQQHPQIRKPAPMLRNKSFDQFSSQSSLAARVARTRNSSQTSADGIPNIQRPTLGALSGSSITSQSPSDRVTEGRGRSNAFTATGTGGQMQCEGRSQSRSEKEEIQHVEDHFSTQMGNVSQQLAKMTSSLRADNSQCTTTTTTTTSKEEEQQEVVDMEGNNSSGGGGSVVVCGLESNGNKYKHNKTDATCENEKGVGKSSVLDTPMAAGSERETTDQRGTMSDSGFESGVYSTSFGKDEEAHCGVLHQAGNNARILTPTFPGTSTAPVNKIIDNLRNERGASPDGKKEEDETLTTKKKEEEEKKSINKLREKSGSDSKVTAPKNKHKNLAAMADLVNSLVSEGKDLEEKEMQMAAECESVQSFYSDDGRRSVISVSELKKFMPVVSSPVHRPSAQSVDSEILRLRGSPSGNSIAVLSGGEEGREEEARVEATRDEPVRSKAAEFVVGSFENSYDEEFTPYSLASRNEDGLGIGGGGRGGGGRLAEVSSPLSSSICNSMVSSVYENVVDTLSGGSDVHHDGKDECRQHTLLGARSSVDSVGSGIVTLLKKNDGNDERYEKEEEEEKELLKGSDEEEEEDAPSIYDRSKPLNPKASKISGHESKPMTTTNVLKSKNSNASRNSDKQVVGSYEDREKREVEGDERTSLYSDILDRASLGGGRSSHSDGHEPILGHGQVKGFSHTHTKLGRQGSYSEQLYSNPELLERSYGSPTLGGIIREKDLQGGVGGYGFDDDDNDDVDNNTAGGVDDEEDEEEEERYEVSGDASTVSYRFDRLDHRLTLYLMMSLFENHEEFVCKISSECVAYMIEEPYESLLVMSSHRFYVLKVTDTDTSQEPSKWLTCVEIQPIPELRYIDVGLGGQSLRLEFVTDCSSYTFITRNRNKTTQFVEVLHLHLSQYALMQGVPSNTVLNEDVDQITQDNLQGDILCKVVPDQPLLLYVMGFIERGHYKKFPVSFVVSPREICLVRANHQWPQPRLQAPVSMETTGKQFTILERQRINNVASMEVCEMTLKKVRLELFNETEGVSTIWNITMATKQSVFDLVQAVSKPWAKEFGVEMDISYSVLDFGKY